MYAGSQKRAKLASCNLRQHGLILIILDKQHQHTFLNYMCIQLSLSLHLYLLYLLFTARRVCITRSMPWQDVCPSVHPSVRPSVTRWYSVEMAKHHQRFFSPSGGQTLSYFFSFHSSRNLFSPLPTPLPTPSLSWSWCTCSTSSPHQIPCIPSRTKKYQSFVSYALSRYQT